MMVNYGGTVHWPRHAEDGSARMMIVIAIGSTLEGQVVHTSHLLSFAYFMQYNNDVSLKTFCT